MMLIKLCAHTRCLHVRVHVREPRARERGRARRKERACFGRPRGYSYRNVNLVEPLFIECRKIHRNLCRRGASVSRAGGAAARGAKPSPPWSLPILRPTILLSLLRVPPAREYTPPTLAPHFFIFSLLFPLDPSIANSAFSPCIAKLMYS